MFKKKRKFPEARLQAQCKRLVENKGCLFRCMDFRRARSRFGAYVFGHTGCPDCLILIPNGKELWVELKSKTGRLSKNQRKEFGLWKTFNKEIHIVRNIRKMNDLLQNALGETEKIKVTKEKKEG